MYLLDTNTCIFYLNRGSVGVAKRFETVDADLLAVSTMTVGELFFGAAKSGRPEANRRRLQVFLSELEVVPFDRRCGIRFGWLKADLRAKRRPIPDFDVAIAATAVATSRVLVSTDAHMAEIDGLLVENWSAS